MKLFQWYKATNEPANSFEEIYLYPFRVVGQTYDAIEINMETFKAKYSVVGNTWIKMKIKNNLFILCESQIDNITSKEANAILTSFLGSDI